MNTCIIGYSGLGVPWISTRACTSKSFKFTAACHLAPRRTIPAVYATNLAYACSMWHGRGQESLHLGRVEGEQLSSWKILVPMRLPRDPFSVRNVRRPWCAFAYEPAVKFKRRVQVTGRSFASQPLRCRASPRLGHAGAVAAPDIRHF